MNEFTDLINKTKEEIMKLQTMMKSQNAFIELHIKEAKLSAYQTAKDIFIKMLDEEIDTEDLCDDLGHDWALEKKNLLEKVKSQLEGEKNEKM